MTAAGWFVLAFLLTLVALLGVLWTGLRWRVRRRRGLHLGLVALTAALLVWTILRAYRLGELHDLEAAGAITPVHMFLARAATAALLLPLTTGVVTLLTGRRHALHRAAAFTAFLLVVAAATTGFWMLQAAPLLEPAG